MLDFPLVAIGASAGGVDALQNFFKAVSGDPGCAFVVVMHLAPDEVSRLPEILQRETRLPVKVPGEGERIETGHVYIIPPGRDLLYGDGALGLVDPPQARSQRRPIDRFFISAARGLHNRCIAVILSGTGTNGTGGLREVKGEGGFTIAQEPATAHFPGMPESARDSGAADLVLPPDKMPAAIADYCRHPYAREGPPEKPDEGTAHKLEHILNVVQLRTGHDFRSYKESTLLRRLQRRMGLRQVEELDAYVDLLVTEPEEATALAKDMLINVTGFFRDHEAWDIVREQVVAPMVREKGGREPIRVWVAGCATGEEAYTLSILFAAEAEKASRSLDIKIFATDPATEPLAWARDGHYPMSALVDVPPALLERYFIAEDDYRRAGAAIREPVIFAPHNLLKDPPFSHMDMVSCRNVLIYLTPENQRRALGLLHFALDENGYLLLGPSESTHGFEGLFSPVSKRWNLYQRVGGTRHVLVEFPLRGGRSREMEELGAALRRAERPTVADVAHSALLGTFGPPAVLVDHDFRILFYHGDLAAYLQPPAGQPSDNLLILSRQGLRARIRAAVHQCRAQGGRASLSAQVKGDGAKRAVAITAVAVATAGDGAERFLVAFEPAKGIPEPALSPAAGADEAALEEALRTTRAELTTTIEQLETSLEEIKASHEEMTSMNEELQSTNEELETSREEYQSLNEELQTMNAQLHDKVAELERQGNHISNLLNSSEVATLFLDRQLCIRWFTPTMTGLVDLQSSDVGRPLGHFAQKFDDPAFLDDAQAVLADLHPRENEVAAGERWLTRRILPYRTLDDHIDGVVVTFVDRTRHHADQLKLDAAREFAEATVETVRHPLLVLNGDLGVERANRAFYDLFRAAPDGTVGRLVYDLGNRQWDIPRLRELLERVLPENEEMSDYEVSATFERIGARTMMLNARRIDHAARILLAIEDVTERTLGEQRHRVLVSELQHRVRNTLSAVRAIAAQTRDSSKDLLSFWEAFEGRLRSLGTVQALMSRTEQDHITLMDIVLEQLVALGGRLENRASLEGPEVRLHGPAGESLALAVHELAVNAIRYGAFAHASGRVHVSWGVEDDDLVFEWRESGLAGLKKPPRRGFGRELLEEGLTYSLGGTAELVFEPTGIQYVARLPASRAVAGVGEAANDEDGE